MKKFVLLCQRLALIYFTTIACTLHTILHESLMIDLFSLCQILDLLFSSSNDKLADTLLKSKGERSRTKGHFYTKAKAILYSEAGKKKAKNVRKRLGIFLLGDGAFSFYFLTPKKALWNIRLCNLIFSEEGWKWNTLTMCHKSKLFAKLCSTNLLFGSDF